MVDLDREGRELNVVVQDTGSSSKQTVQLEVNLINIGPSASKSLLLHVGREQARRREADILGHNSLALALASQSQRARKRHTGDSLLRRSDAAEVEALQGEVGRLAAGGLESCGVVEACGEDVLDGDVRLRLRCDSDRREGNVDGVETVPVEALVGADGLEGCYGDCNFDVVKLGGD
jgi:hypothetical protein